MKSPGTTNVVIQDVRCGLVEALLEPWSAQRPRSASASVLEPCQQPPTTDGKHTTRTSTAGRLFRDGLSPRALQSNTGNCSTR